MEIPFYYSFKEFEKEYIFDFEKFKDEFLNFEDYLKYQYERVGKEYDRLSIDNYLLTNDEIQQFCKIEGITECMNENLINDLLEQFPEYYPDYKKGDSKKDYLLKVRLGIVKFDSNQNDVDEERESLNDKILNIYLKDLFLSNLDEIENFIVSKLLEIKNLSEIKPQNIDFPETEPYQTETGKGKNIPYKLELLKQLGIMDNLNSKYDNNKEQLYRILDFLTGGNSKNYYLSMYGDDYNGKDKVTSFHTAYLRKNGLI